MHQGASFLLASHSALTMSLLTRPLFPTCLQVVPSPYLHQVRNFPSCNVSQWGISSQMPPADVPIWAGVLHKIMPKPITNKQWSLATSSNNQYLFLSCGRESHIPWTNGCAERRHLKSGWPTVSAADYNSVCKTRAFSFLCKVACSWAPIPLMAEVENS